MPCPEDQRRCDGDGRSCTTVVAVGRDPAIARQRRGPEPAASVPSPKPAAANRAESAGEAHAGRLPASGRPASLLQSFLCKYPVRLPEDFARCAVLSAGCLGRHAGRPLHRHRRLVVHVRICGCDTRDVAGRRSGMRTVTPVRRRISIELHASLRARQPAQPPIAIPSGRMPTDADRRSPFTAACRRPAFVASVRLVDTPQRADCPSVVMSCQRHHLQHALALGKASPFERWLPAAPLRCANPGCRLVRRLGETCAHQSSDSS